MLKRVKLSSLRPNPWRRFDTYKIVNLKIEALEESIESTGFWKGQITARSAGRGYEIAWGHHRWVAARNVLGENAFIEIIVDDLDDDEMYMRMCRENNDVYNASAAMDVEAVESGIIGYCEGRIHLKQIKGKQQVKAADYVSTGSAEPHETFSRESLADHTGIPLHRIKSALDSLKLVHVGVQTVENIEDLTPRQAQDVAAAVRKTRAAAGDAAAKRVAKKAGEAIRKKTHVGHGGSRGKDAKPAVSRIADEEISKAKGENQDLRRFLKKVESATNATATAANKIRDLLDTLEAANVQNFSGAPAAELERAFKRINESMRMFTAAYPSKANLKLVK